MPPKRLRTMAVSAHVRRVLTGRRVAVGGALVVLLVAAIFAPYVLSHPSMNARQASSTPTRITVNASALQSRISPFMFGQDLFYLDAGQTVFANAEHTSYDSTMLGYAQGIHPTILRCGGGLDSEWYHWVYGIGPLASRTPTRMTHRKYIRVDDFGTDDCLHYAETLGAAPIIQVDTNDYPVSRTNSWNPQATPQEAAAWVAYTNGSPTNLSTIGVDAHGVDWKTVSYWATKRGVNGHPFPYNVHYWEIGNEDYTISGQDGTHYGQRFLVFANAMKAVDPTIQTGAVLFNDVPSNPWNTQVPQTAKRQINFVIDHDYPMGDTSMERFFSPQTITRTVSFPVTASGTYTIDLKATSYYAIAANSRLTFTIDNASFSADILPTYSFYDTLVFTVPGSKLSTNGVHYVTIQLSTVQHYVEIYKDLTVNGSTVSLFPLQEIYQNLVTTLQKVNWYLDGLRATITSAGLSPSVPMFITEYNVEMSATLVAPTYSASLLTTMLLMKYIEHGASMASMWLLSEPTPQNWLIISTEISHSTGREHWRNAQDYGFEILRHHTAPYRVGATIANSPTDATGAPVLDVLATKDLTNNILHLVVTNSSYNQAVSTTMTIANAGPRSAATVTTLNAPSLLSVSSSPTNSQIATTSKSLGLLPPSFAYMFPAHSVTAFDVPLAPGVLLGPASGTMAHTATLLTSGDSSWGNYAVNYAFTPLWVTTTHDQFTGVKVRYTGGSQNWAQVIFRPGGVSVVQHSAWGYAHEIRLSGTVLHSGHANAVTVIVWSDHLIVYLNGVRLGSVALSSMPARGGIQFYSYYSTSVAISNAVVKSQ